MSLELPISALRPTSLTSSTSIRGLVTLVWPYSQSTQSCAFLLAAEDFRLRSQRGQVRVVFGGTAARAVAENKVGILDLVVLNLRGARWHEGNDVHTPGRSVDGELHFTHVLDLSVVEDGVTTKQVSVCASPSSRDAEITEPVPSTPLRPSRLEIVSVKAVDELNDTFGSPAYLRTTKSSTNLDHDPFFDLDNTDGPRKRARFSFGSIKDWRYESEPRSSQNEKAASSQPSDEVPTSSPALSTAAAAAAAAVPPYTARSEPTSSSMTPPPKPAMQPPALPLPQLRMPQDTRSKSMSTTDKTPTTPKLHPVSASTLPLPSPFPNESIQSHFDAFRSVQSSEGGQLKPSNVAGGQKQLAVSEASATTGALSRPAQNNDDVETLVRNDPDVSSRHHAVPIQGTLPSHAASLKQGDAAIGDKISTISKQQQTIREREQSRKQTLDSLFGFQSSSATLEMPPGADIAQGMVRTPSEFEMAESHAMRQLAQGGNASEPRSTLLDTQSKEPNGSMLKHDSVRHNAHISNTATEVLKTGVPAYSVDQVDTTPQDKLGLAKQAVPQHIDKDCFLTVPSTFTEALNHSRLSQDTAMTSSFAVEETDAAMNDRELPTEATEEQEHEEVNEVRTNEHHASAVLMDLATPRVSGTVQKLRDEALSTPHQGDSSTSILTPSSQTHPTTRASFPVALRKWMSPKGQTSIGTAKDDRSANAASPLVGQEELLTRHSQFSDRAGLQTSLGYFTALKRLREYINMISQPGSPANTVDVIAIVKSSTHRPRRQTGEPGDFYTSLRVTDDTLDDRSTIQVNIYRPFNSFLPTAAAGDVILLRGFTVKSRSHKPYLKSNDESAWCVWRYSLLDPKEVAAEGEENQPFDQTLPTEEVVREEVHGPPIEYGEEETEEANRLHDWLVSPTAQGRAVFTERTIDPREYRQQEHRSTQPSWIR